MNLNLKTRTLQSSPVIQKIPLSKEIQIVETLTKSSHFFIFTIQIITDFFYLRQIKTDSGVLEMWPLLEFVIKEANRRRGHYSGPRKLLGGPLGEELTQYHCLLAT